MGVQRRLKTGLGWALMLAAGAATAWAVRDYRKWRALGPGGLPATPAGWLTMTRYRLHALDELDARPLLALAAPAGGAGAWPDSSPRPGARPAVSPYPIPHRQVSQLPDEPTRAALAALFDAKVKEHAEEVEYALSHFEKRHPAITLRNTTGRMGALAYGEIAHIHPSDYSMHMILHASDAAAAIDKGWAQRHGLAGLAVGLPETYVMVYAPRDRNDLLVIAELLEAAIAFAQQPDGVPGGSRRA